MNYQETSIKHSALGWVKKSIDDNLSEIETDLKQYIEQEDAELLERVRERLDVIQGVLMMIEQYGAAMLTEEMVALVGFIRESSQEKSEQALEVMLRAVLQLPDYLEHIQSGHRDIPIAILPLLNDIRAVRNQDLFSEKLLFLPDLSMHQEGADAEAISEEQNQASKLLTKKLRPIYQLALVKIIKDEAVEESLKRLEKVCETLEERSVSEQVARIWWIVGALLESVSRQQLELGVSIKNLLGKVDALFRVILIIGERGLQRRQPIELIKNFLYYIAQPECDGPKAQAIKTAYRLEQFLPSESARSEVLDNIAGPNQALLKTVAEAMKADIEAIKSTLEVYVNGDLANVAALKDVPQEMHIISDTLAMIGLGSQRQLVEAQIEVVTGIVDGNQAPDEEQLLSMAAELLQVEQALDQMQKRQPVSEAPRSETDVSRDYELDNVLTAVVTAALDDIQKTKNAILEFIKDPGRTENIELCVTLMQESRGALLLMNRHEAVAVIDGLLRYLRGYDVQQFMETSRLDALSQVVVSLEYYLEALGEHRSDAGSILEVAEAQLQQLLDGLRPAPEGEAETAEADTAAPELTVVASAPAADEEAAAVAEITQPQAPDIETAREADRAIEPEAAAEVPPEPAAAAAMPEEIEAAPEPAPLEAEPEAPEKIEAPVESAPQPAAEVVDLSPEPPPGAATAAAPAEPGSAAPAAFEPAATAAEKHEVEAVDDELEVLKPGSDPDILEIYLEEAEEESQNILRLQQDWLLHPEDENALKNIRRAFHTIKGSGRLVGAMKIGEFAWDYEQLLNRVIDRTVAPNKQIIDAVGRAARALPQLVEELKTSQPPSANISYLRGLARALAEFDAEQLLIEHTQQIPRIESPDDRITDSDETTGAGEATEWKGMGVGATTQILPPEKITTALLEEIEPDTMRVDPSAFEDREAELQQGSVYTVPEGAYDDTILAQPPEIPPSAPAEAEPAIAQTPDESEYTQAIDYAQSSETAAAGPEASLTAAEAEQPAAAAETPRAEAAPPEPEPVTSEPPLEPEPLEAVPLDEIEPQPHEEIHIETMGEDFVGDDFEVLEDISLDSGSMNEQVEAQSIAADEAGLTFEGSAEAEPDEVEFEPIEMEEPTAVAGDTAVQEITLSAPEFEELTASEAEAETAPATGETEAAEVSATEPAEEIPIEVPAPEDTERQAAADADESGGVIGQVAAAAAPEREAPPDPFVDATRSQQPGGEAGPGPSTDQEPAAPTGLSFDPELLIIYQQEVEQHLSIVNSALDRAEQIQELIPSEEIYRALHTIHGASRTADISTIGELAGLMEKPLKSAVAQKMALDQEIVALYREGQRAIEAMTAELVSTRQLPNIPEDLEISFKALAEDFEEHTVEIPEEEEEPTGEFVDTLTMMSESVDDEQDNELLTIFVDEANELLEMSDNTLHEWAGQQADDSGAQDYGAVMELQRYLHTLKGGARMAELSEISDLAHEMESMFIAVIDGRVDKNDNLIEMLRDAFDLLHQQVVEAQEGRDMSKSEDLVDALKSLRLGEDEDYTGAESDAGIDVDSEDIDIVAENLAGEPLSAAERPGQDVIKVRSDLLDNLVSSAGEVSIYRARMEQQVAGLGSHLGELGQTIARLKSQLRNLEAETDAQIHYSHRSESGRSDFDPLEMDRYTMIQELSRSLSESVNDLSSLQHMLGEQVRDSETLLLQQSRVSTDLQDGLIKSRMVKFSGLLSRLRRLVRQSSQELGKKAELVITGEENEVDNKVLDRMVAPLEHIIRNALSHGIETPVERVKKGKPESGKITIDITRDGSEIVIRVSDDGAGVNIEKVRSRAIQLGLLDKSHQISEADLVQYILEPGFSTADHVTQLSGRGVGMDVVDIEIKQLGGTLQIQTNPQGTTFIARLPFTLSINQAILVSTGEETYAIPLINIEGITRLDQQSLLEYYRQENPSIEYAGQQFALHSLAKLVDAGAPHRGGAENEKQPVILSRSGDLRVALHVDEIMGNREIVVKTLGKQLSQVKGLAGASILADGSVVLILDINGLIRQSAANAVKIVYQADQAALSRSRDTVMVVDDSITMRRVASKLLERHNYDVITAKDGVDALAQLQDVRPDVMLLDIEMPRMDGFELATHMQNEESYSKIPIIMITSRTGEKHRDRAFEIGVTNYMGKPYQEDELIETIQSALAR